MAVKFSAYRTSDINGNLNNMGIRPLDVMVTGVTGAGKSTTLNAFFQKTVAKVGSGVDPETMELDAYALNDFFRVWDTPGLGDGIKRDQIHKKKMQDLLNMSYEEIFGFIDLVLVVLEGSNRDMGTTYTLLNDVILPNIQSDRVLIVINQADLAMKGRYWNQSLAAPNAELLSYLDNQAESIKKRIKEATGIIVKKPICYSAEYGWNVQAVYDFIIDNMPKEKRLLKGVQ